MLSLYSMPSSTGRLAACVLWMMAAIYADATAADECPARRDTPLMSVPQPPQGKTPGPVDLQAQSVEALSPDVIELRGGVEATRDGEKIRADYLRHDRRTNDVEVRGNVSISRPNGAEFSTSEGEIDLDTREGHVAAGSYRLPLRYGRGEMERAELLDANRTRLHGVTYTTCPAGRDDWAIRAARIDIDTENNVGVARHTTLKAGGVPLLYLPYFRFPLTDERQSGFLVPQFGYSDNLGTAIGAPYYLNLAPNYDATLTPRLLTKRGLQLQTQFRYLGESLNGQVDAEYLPDDRVTGENRGSGTLLHRQSLSPRWSAAVDLRGVSDRDYLSDFGGQLDTTSVSHLPQNAEMNYRGSTWTFTGRVSDYQTVDRTLAATERPYARLPQLVLSGSSGPTTFGTRFRVDNEYNYFDRSASISGQRLNVNPAVSLPLSRIYGFLTPEFGIKHISYDLSRASFERDSISVPYMSVDSGLFFEREMRIGDGLFDHTLEPRLFYLYVPFREQDHLPTFDTSLPDFSFANLFRTNRFIGGDRIGDANQLTFALTSRLLDQQTGVERASASIGRIYYFDDRRVNVPAGTATSNNSDIAGEFIAWLDNNWHARASIQWSPEINDSARSTYYLQHQPAANKIFNVGYRYIRDQIAQSDISAEWPVGTNWVARGRSLYSLRDNTNVESYFGLQYNSCCWIMRFYTARRLVQAPSTSGSTTEQRRAFGIEFELAGLSRSSGRFESPLRQGLFSFPSPNAP